jgi:transposase-like protein
MKRSGVLNHPKAATIDLALRRGVPITELAERYGISTFALYRWRAIAPEQRSAQIQAAQLNKSLKVKAGTLDETDGSEERMARLETELAMFSLDQARARSEGRDRDVIAFSREIRAIAKEIEQLKSLRPQAISAFSPENVVKMMRDIVFEELRDLPERQQRIAAEIDARMGAKIEPQHA